ncbi:MAG: FAD-binding oxidoreductase [Bdellovibrio sp.]|nr:FAD-binding oxidoreductase [Bdellovibrio sp.]
MSISYWLDESKTNSKNFDAVIIGAGIAGLSTAYWLEKKDPTLNIAIVDKHSLGFGASGRNAGFITCGSAEHFNKLNQQFGFEKAIEIWKFSEQNRELLKSEIMQDDVSTVDYLSTGSCTVAASENDWTRYHTIFADMQRAKIDVELIDEKYLASQYGVRNFQGAIQYKHDGVIHPVKLLKKIKSRLNKTTFLLGEEVFSVKSENGSSLVRTQHHQLNAKKVFVCLNGFASMLLPELKNHVKPQRGQIVVTEALPAFVKGPCYLTKHLCYFRQLPTGELLVGGFRNHDIEAENTALDETTDKIQKALTEFTQSYFQSTTNVKINYRWSGIMGFTNDGQMIIGAHPSKQGVYLMAGCSGHGMGLSFNSARVMVENSYGAQLPSHFDIKRIQF